MPAKYDNIGKLYDATRRADSYIAARLAALLRPEPSSRIVDVACGSGNYTVALAIAGLKMTGIDQSRRMIERAHRKSSAVDWCHGDAAALPFHSDAFDGALCTLAVHHFQQIELAFSEIRRVLRRGRLVILTASHEQMRNYWLNAYFPIAMDRSIDQMPDLPDVQRELQNAGFARFSTERYDVRDNLQDFFLYSGKHRPTMYLDPNVRAGISTFSLLADEGEIESGCELLARDIASGDFDDVRKRFDGQSGDYLFVIAE